jgi:Glycosyltransferase family 87
VPPTTSRVIQPAPPSPAPAPSDSALPAGPGPAGPGPAGGVPVLAAGAGALTCALAVYAGNLLGHPRAELLNWLDLRLYLAAGQVARDAPATLYHWQFRPEMRFTYPPFAALLFAATGRAPWALAGAVLTAAGVVALGLVVWLTFGALGWASRRRLGAAMAVTAIAFWSEPVQRALHWGQVDVLLMALVVWDVCQPGRRRWQGAGIGLAAGIKLVPLIFLPYLILTGRPRQAAVCLATFAATVAAGWAVLPAASAQWWLGGDFLRAGRTGFVGYVANQSLLGLLTREAGGAAAATLWWLTAAALVGVTGLAAAACWHRNGRPAHGWVTCALTGLLLSPVSWDHHWVWAAPLLAVLVDAAVRTGQHRARWGRVRWGRAAWAPVAAVTLLFAAWPTRWPPPPGLPWGLIWSAPHSPGVARDHPWDSEYHWHALGWLAGNLYLLAGLTVLAGLVAMAPCAPLAAAGLSPAAGDGDDVDGPLRERHVGQRPGTEPQVGHLAV